MTSKLVIITLAALVGVSWGYSGGAPEEVCEDMVPKHPVDPQTSALPYTVTVDKSTIKAGESVKITIAGKKPFKGYLLQVRDGKEAVGTFNVDGGDRYTKTINCFSKKEVFKTPLEKHVHYFIRQVLHMINRMVNEIVPIDLNPVFYRGQHVNNAVTHKNSADKKSLALEWTPPSGAKKTYTVYATVAENGGVFWVRQPTAKITVE